MTPCLDPSAITSSEVDVGRDEGTLTQLRRGVLPNAVLAVLGDGERYGVELVELLSGDPRLAVSEGTLYPLLARLRRDGLVATRWGESTAGPPRRYHHLTSAGEQQLAAFRSEWRAFRQAVDDLLDPPPGTPSETHP